MSFKKLRSNKRGRKIDGFLLLDKPIGQSSNTALQNVKKIYYAEKVGHTGSLDPLATGMLPICFGEATKFSQFLLDANKSYRVTGVLGIKTATCDQEGEIISTRDASHITQADLEAILPKFRGAIKQVPSMFSALKHEGKRLYEFAREGIEIEREAREITILELKMLDFNLEHKTFSLDVTCSKGTYIRNLIDDIGEALGCGAYVSVLRRTGVAAFREDQMLTMDQLETLRGNQEFEALDQLILPLDDIANSLPIISVTEATSFQLRQGSKIAGFSAYTPGLVSIKANDKYFIGIGEVLESGELIPKRLIQQD